MSVAKKIPKITDPDFQANKHTGHESWHAFEIMAEFVEATESLKEITPAVSIFGSARTKPDHPCYQMAEKIARLVSDAGFSVISGGGPGIMEAACRGAHDAGAPAIGFNITLPHEQLPNPYTTPELTFRFHYFAMRKMHLAMRANALVVFPGGFGTLDELFEVLTLHQTGKATNIPVILFDESYWRSVITFESLLDAGMIEQRDLALFSYAETAESAWTQLLARGITQRVEPKNI